MYNHFILIASYKILNRIEQSITIELMIAGRGESRVIVTRMCVERKGSLLSRRSCRAAGRSRSTPSCPSSGTQRYGCKRYKIFSSDTAASPCGIWNKRIPAIIRRQNWRSSPWRKLLLTAPATRTLRPR